MIVAIMQRVIKNVATCTDQLIYRRGLSSLSELRNQFRQLPGGSVDLTKDERSGIGTIILSNPGRKNAITGKMMVDFDDCVSDLEKWVNGKFVILAGSNGTFCSGGDTQTVRENLYSVGIMCEVMQNAATRLFNLPLISVAAIDGYAIGGGAELATACDFRIMMPSAKTGFIHVKLNIATGFGGCSRLVQLLGRTTALRLLLSGNIMDAETAYRVGFVNDIIEEHGDIVELGKQWLKVNCVGDTDATKVIKQMVSAGEQVNQVESLKREGQLFRQIWGNNSHIAALRSHKKHK